MLQAKGSRVLAAYPHPEIPKEPHYPPPRDKEHNLFCHQEWQEGIPNHKTQHFLAFQRSKTLAEAEAVGSTAQSVYATS